MRQANEEWPASRWGPQAQALMAFVPFMTMSCVHTCVPGSVESSSKWALRQPDVFCFQWVHISFGGIHC